MRRLLLAILISLSLSLAVVGCIAIPGESPYAPGEPEGIGSIRASGPITGTSAIFTDTVTVSGRTTTGGLTSSAVITGTSGVFTDTLGVTGRITAGGLTASDTITGTDAVLTGTLGVTGRTTTGGLTSSGTLTGTNAVLTGTLNVTGATGLTGALTASTSITTPIVNASNGVTITGNSSLTLSGAGTTWEDLRIDGLQTRTGVVAPTDEVGFRGSASFYARNFVHNQADEVQFTVQFPHQWREASMVEPHVHFSPWITNTGTAAVSFVLDCFWADVDDLFPASSTMYTMTKTWSGDKRWYHLIADAAGLDMTGLGFSNLGKCRLYRDNTVANNLAGKVTFQYFDIHYEVDSLGTRSEYTK